MYADTEIESDLAHDEEKALPHPQPRRTRTHAHTRVAYGSNDPSAADQDQEQLATDDRNAEEGFELARAVSVKYFEYQHLR